VRNDAHDGDDRWFGKPFNARSALVDTSSPAITSTSTRGAGVHAAPASVSTSATISNGILCKRGQCQKKLRREL